jgi:nucleotide-binding universal stress UspA family protein
MYKHILIPTDGSELSRAAIEHGIALATSVKAKVTAITVTTPFHVFAIEPGMLTDTPEQYEKHAADLAAKDLNVANEAAKTAGISSIPYALSMNTHIAPSLMRQHRRPAT